MTIDTGAIIERIAADYDVLPANVLIAGHKSTPAVEVRVKVTRELAALGMTPAAIAEALRCSQLTITRYLKRPVVDIDGIIEQAALDHGADVQGMTTGGKSRAETNARHQAVEMMTKAGLTRCDISNALGITKWGVKKIINMRCDRGIESDYQDLAPRVKRLCEKAAVQYGVAPCDVLRTANMPAAETAAKRWVIWQLSQDKALTHADVALLTRLKVGRITDSVRTVRNNNGKVPPPSDRNPGKAAAEVDNEMKAQLDAIIARDRQSLALADRRVARLLMESSYA